ncbi:Fc.00g074010.m01.CDS01 [Cosmosporella sp. VM-42]
MGSQGPSSKEILLDAIAEALGNKALDTVKPTEVEIPEYTEVEFEKGPVCITQNPIPANFKNGPADIVVGLRSECPRWTPGSVIKWAAWRAGFSSQEAANHAAEHLAIAAEVWNQANVGVTFEWVPLAKDATFVLCQADADPQSPFVLASAFFPNANDLNYVYVYPYAFGEVYKDSMWQIFTHELGHVLGLRHEFAVRGEGLGAVRLGPRNELSVMNYRSEALPEMQQSDIDSTKEFYAMRKDANGNPPKVGRTVVVDYVPQ